MASWGERIRRWLPLLVVGGGLWAYANSFSGAFLFDDQTVLVNNPKIYRLWPPWAAVETSTRWVSDISFAVNCAVSRFNVADYHATNLLIHILAGLLLYGVVHRTLRLPRWGGRHEGAAAWLALGVALVWVVHPLTTEAVTYIIQRIESLMGLFYLLGLYLFIRGAGSERPRGWLNASVAACAVGMGTKEMIVTLPVAIWIYDWVFVAESWRGLWRARWKYYTALALTWGIFGLSYLLIVPKLAAEGGLCPPEITPLLYLLTEAGVILHYLRLVVAPYPLCLDYAWPMAAGVREAVAPGLAVWSLLGLTVWGVVKRRWYGFPGAVFFLVLSLTSSVIPLPDAAVEHRMYLPLAAAIAVLGVLGYEGVRRGCERWGVGCRVWAPVGIGLGCALVVGLAGLTRARNEDYASEESMWKSVQRARPENYRAYIHLASGLFNAGKYGEAGDICRQLLRRLPACNGMTDAEIRRLWNSGYDSSRPLRYYALAEDILGNVWLARGDTGKAIPCYGESIRVMPESTAYHNLAVIYYGRERWDEAIAHWQAALRLAPRDPDAHYYLGQSFLAKGMAPAAIRYYRQTLAIQPDHTAAKCRLAWLLATSDDESLRHGAEALRMAREVLDATDAQSPAAWDGFAAACAETGDFAAAITAAETAIRLSGRTAKDEGATRGTAAAEDPGIAGKRREYLSRYRAGKPLREGVPKAPSKDTN